MAAPRGPQDDPKRPQELPKTAKDRPKTAQDDPKTAHCFKFGACRKMYKNLRKINDFCHPYGPKWLQIGSPTVPRRPQDLPRGPQDGPRGPQDGPRDPKTAQDGAEVAQEPPKTAQDPTKTAPRRSKSASPTSGKLGGRSRMGLGSPSWAPRARGGGGYRGGASIRRRVLLRDDGKSALALEEFLVEL